MVSVGTVTTSERKSLDAFAAEAFHCALMVGEKMVSVLVVAVGMMGDNRPEFV
jgi:hypothetical protein